MIFSFDSSAVQKDCQEDATLNPMNVAIARSLCWERGCVTSPLTVPPCLSWTVRKMQHSIR